MLNYIGGFSMRIEGENDCFEKKSAGKGVRGEAEDSNRWLISRMKD